jgi:PAS domain S-box-containing protein
VADSADVVTSATTMKPKVPTTTNGMAALVEAIAAATEGRYDVPLPAATAHGDLARLAEAFEALRAGLRADDAATRRLRQDFLRAQITVDRAPDAAYWLNRAGDLVYVNDAACRSLGYTRDELLSMTVFDIDPSISRDQWESFWTRVPALQPICLETVHRARDGRAFPVEITGTRLSFAGEDYSCTYARDLSDQRQAEAALRESEERLRLALAAANQGLYDLDLETGLAQTSPEYATMLGYEPEEFRETHERWLERLHPDDREGVVKEYDAYLRGERPQYSVEFRQRTKSGDWKWILSLGRIVERRDDGRPLRMLGTRTDITALKRAEEALRATDDFLRRSQQVGRVGSYRLDITRGVWVCSPMLDEVFGIDDGYQKDVAGWLALVAPGDRGVMHDYFTNDVVAERQRFDREYRIVRPRDGQLRWVHGMGELEFDSSGRPVVMIGTIQDITERKHAEDDRARLESQLLQAQRIESVGRLAGGVAHDFNNMLTVILGYAELIGATLQPGDPLLKDIGEIARAAEHSRDITRQLLAFSRKQIIEPRVVDLNEVIVELKNTLLRLIGEDVDLRVRPASDLGRVRMDRSQVEQVLVNLVVNARDAMPDGGALTIETSNTRVDEAYCRSHAEFVPGHYAVLAVSDNGVGMDRETLSSIFDPFFTTKEVGKGTGLGLAMVHGVVKQNRGQVNVYSERGTGTTFRIYLPVVEQSPEPARPVEASAPSPDAGAVLLVEDDEMVRAMTAQMLASLGYTPLVAATPRDALAVLARPTVAVDLLLTDVVMPDMSGTQLRDRARALRPDLRVLFTSGYTSNAIVHHGVLEQGVSFLPKPFTRQQLGQKIRETLQDS